MAGTAPRSPSGADDVFSARQEASESASLKQPALTEAWMRALTPRERSLLMDVLAQETLTERLNSGDNVELRATGAGFANSLIPRAETFELAALGLDDPSIFIGELRGERDLIWIHNALQIVNETRVFLGACFSRLKVGGVLLVTVPHQFLFERKLTPPSRRDPRHRRFYTPTTLLSDVEEAIDPAEFRLRFLFESDFAYDYTNAVPDAPAGGQDIVLALERVPCPPWRATLDLDDSVARQATAPVRQRPMDNAHEAPTRMLAPDPRPIQSILVLKLDHRGDFILAQRAFSIMRRVFSDAEMTLVCGAWNVDHAAQSGLFDHIVAFDFFREDDSIDNETAPRAELIETFARLLGGKAYDLAVDLRLYDDTRRLLQAVEARHKAGFDRHDVFPFLDIRLNTPSASHDDQAETRVVSADRFNTSLGTHGSYEIRNAATTELESEAAVIWGPYHALSAGRYCIEVLIEAVDEDFEFKFDVVSNFGREQYVAGVLRATRDTFPRIDLDAAEPIALLELRIYASRERQLPRFRFFGMKCDRLGTLRGVHQGEAMALLAHLVALRLENPETSAIVG